MKIKKTIVLNKFDITDKKNLSRIIYYCIVNGFIQINKYVENHNMINFLFKIIDENIDIDLIFSKYFKEYMEKKQTEYSFIMNF